MKKTLTKITDLTVEEIKQIINDAFDFKQKYDQGRKNENLLDGKTVAMVFEKPSLRTKIAFETATGLLGGVSTFLTGDQIIASGNNQKGRESLTDIAKNLERFADLVLMRVYSHETIFEVDKAIDKPVINALCDFHHPTQALADVMAILWHKKKYEGVKVAFVGDGNNVATSLMQICAMLGIDFSIASPEGYQIPLTEKLVAQKLSSGGKLEFLVEPKQALKGADVVYTDTFVSMGQEKETKKRLEDFKSYRVDLNLFDYAKKDAVFMHCLPAHRGEEVTDMVMDSPSSIVFDQAECRLHVAKALLKFFLV